ncbi:hypothetical protein [Singulisphaera sp. PoT]|uniref:hypothetical protein n=1 Tax=Singulisphaera sp. PoT TaxID=3411797 RepID=UPI003BF58C6C
MISLERGHLTTTHDAAVKLDQQTRAWDHEQSAYSLAGSVGDLVRVLREQGDYWERVQTGRLSRVKRLIARLGQPFFRPQIRYNLLLAEVLGRVEFSLAELRREAEARRSESD